MNDEQRQYFLACHAGLWSWVHESGVYVARSCWEGRKRYREFPLFLLQHYPYDYTKKKYRQVRKLVEERPYSNLESDVRLAQVVGRDLNEVLPLFGLDPLPPSERQPDHLIYTTRGSGLTWPVAAADGLYLVNLKGSRNSHYVSMGISVRPYDLSKRWVNLYTSTANHHDYTWEMGLADFDVAARDIDSFRMAAAL